MEKNFNIVLVGVGGQGIGILSEIISRGLIYAGYSVKGADTHGLAQRGGIVTSFIRIGDSICSPLIRMRNADFVFSMERYEGLRAMDFYLKDNGTLIYYEKELLPVSYEEYPIDIVTNERIIKECEKRNIKHFIIPETKLSDNRITNTLLLAFIVKNKILSGFTLEYCIKAMEDIMTQETFNKNMEVFNKEMLNLKEIKSLPQEELPSLL